MVRRVGASVAELCYNEAKKRMSFLLPAAAGALAALLPEVALATLNVSNLYAGGISWSEVINHIFDTLGYSIFIIAVSAFMVGALMYTAGFISEENKSKGKNLMIGSLVGMTVVMSAKAIFNAAYFFVYGN